MPRYILTGTPGAGKTAVLRLLEFRGQFVVEEAATDVIALEHALGNADPWNAGPGEVSAFIDKIVTVQRSRQAHAGAAASAPVFFDRSPVCTLALSRYTGHPPTPLLVDEIDRVVTGRVYEPTVFFIRNQGFVERTAARRISYADSLTFERIHEGTYRELGFHLVDVPPGPLAERAALVQHTVQRRQPAAEH